MAKSAKSKAVSKRETAVAKKEKPAEAPLTTKVENGSPYQLDPAQVERAATALIANMKKHAQAKEDVKRNLLEADEDAPAQGDAAIFLTLSTKQHILESSRLKPSAM
jgi:ribosome biogenesis protein UTP30